MTLLVNDVLIYCRRSARVDNASYESKVPSRGSSIAPAPLPVGETGVARARAAGAEGDHPACTSGFRWWKLSGLDVRAEGRGDRPGRSRIFRDFTLARARAEPLAPKQKEGVCAAAKRRPVGSRETG